MARWSGSGGDPRRCAPARRAARWRALAALLAILGVAPWGGCRRETPLPDLGALPPFRLTDQRGRPFGSADLSGAGWVADFIFTTCTTICPTLTRRMARLQRETADLGQRLRLVSFTVDPENDTPAVLRRYSARFGADPARWAFLTGSLDAIRETVVQGFKVALERRGGGGAGSDDPSSIFHSSHLVLVDGRGHIRGYHRVTSDDDLARVVRDARRLPAR